MTQSAINMGFGEGLRVDLRDYDLTIYLVSHNILKRVWTVCLRGKRNKEGYISFSVSKIKSCWFSHRKEISQTCVHSIVFVHMLGLQRKKDMPHCISLDSLSVVMIIPMTFWVVIYLFGGLEIPVLLQLCYFLCDFNLSWFIIKYKSVILNMTNL